MVEKPTPRPDGEANAAGERAPGPVSVQLRELLDELAGAPERDLREAWLKGLREGELVGRFELLRELGRGGFGVVYEARDRELGRLVAFKAVRPGNRSVSEMREQWLQREAEAAAQLHHPNIVTLHDAGKSEHGPFLIFELLDGETLAERLARGPLPVRQALTVAVEVARGLAHAHASGVVHRDLKPSNVFLTADGGVKVLDFGLAHVFGASGLRGGGTPVYMAPEQWRQEPDDERVDVFALGTILFQCIAGEPPFRLVDDRSTVLEPGPAPRLDQPGAPAALHDLVAAMLAKDPAGRPRTGQAVLARLAEVEAALVAAGSRPPEPAPEPATRRRRLLGVAAALAVATATAWAVWWVVAREPARRLAVAVADIRNETGEADLERLSGMLITSLEQSRRLVVLTRERMLDVARQVTGERPEVIDETLGREIARRTRATAVALASVRRFGSVYAIDLQVMDPGRNEYLFAAREQGRKEEVPVMLDRLSERMRAGLKERTSEIEATRVELSRVATANLQAWQHFVRGEELFELQQASEAPAWSAAREEYRRAAALAPDFVMAHYRIAYTLSYEGLVQRAREALGPALVSLERVPAKERAYLQALAAALEGRSEEAARQYRAVLADFPEEKHAWHALSQLSANRAQDFDHARAIEYARKALELAPDFAPAWEQLLVSLFARGEDGLLLQEAQRYAGTVTSVSAWENLGHAQLVAGRDADAEKTFQHMIQVMPGSPAGWLGLGMARLQRLDLDGAAEAYRRLAAAPDPRRSREGRYGLSWVAGFRGRFREAASRLDEVVRLDERVDRSDLGRAYGQQVLWTALGRGAPPEELVKRGLALVDPAAEPYVDHRHFYWFAAYAALVSGPVERAQAWRQPGEALGGIHCDRLLRAAAARARGHPEEARADLTRRYSPRDLAQALDFHQAEWALEDGRPDEAVAGASATMALPIFPPHLDVAGFRAALWPRALLLRARAHQARGDLASAWADLSRLLDLWQQADRDAPAVVQARALRRRLAPAAR